MTKIYRLLASWTKVIIVNLQIRKIRAFLKKTQMYTLKNLLVYVTALAGAQQQQSTLQNTETWNTTNSKSCLVLKEF